MRLLLVCIAVALPARGQSPALLDLKITGGTVIDGSGSPGRIADVGIRAGRIVVIGDLASRGSKNSIDARNMVVAPGFIDVHAHADSQALNRRDALNFLHMGVTTIVTGNCGSSVGEFTAHFTKLAKDGIGVNYGSLLGHGTVRSAVMGTAARHPTSAELERMQQLVEKAMGEGAFGISTGLIYVPGTYAKTEEIVALARAAKKHGGLYVSHMRNEGDNVLDAIDEALRIGQETGISVHLSHLKASGKNNWGRSKQIVARIKDARARGMRVTGDQYAYTASSTSLDVLFPAKELQITRGRFAKKLNDSPEFRKKMHRSLIGTMERMGFGDFAYCQIAFAPNNAGLAGMTIKAAAKKRLGKDGRDAQAKTTIDLFIESKGRRISMVYHKMCEPDVEAIMRQPFVAVACDAGIRVRGAARPHPRGAGNNPRVLGRYVRDRAVLPLELAVHKMTGLPASTFGLGGRGSLAPGAHADLVIFDPKTVADKATYDEPYETPIGIPWVIVNGVPAIVDGKFSGKRTGKILRHQASEPR
ncbi:MAG: D-aminoacylase [Planctomycetes bacterium]|nr:D-aminoacylase [Planctomycetota bacterium]